MSIYVAFYKPYGVLCQFTSQNPTDITLSQFNLPQNIYAAGRLDKDSEGLLILTNDGQFNQKVAHPSSLKNKTYWVQVEGVPNQESLTKLSKGIKIKDYQTKACKVSLIEDPIKTPRIPPIRERKTIPTSWLEIELIEGKNRQLRRMTAAIGHPTLRLIRCKIGHFSISSLLSGQWIYIKKEQVL
jgi:23S rRNA pseudouridine2457 synthase